MSVDERQIQENCQDLWQTALGLGLEQPTEVPISEESTLSSYVNVNGEWQGAVILECPESIVRHAAASGLYPATASAPSHTPARSAVITSLKSKARRMATTGGARENQPGA